MLDSTARLDSPSQVQGTVPWWHAGPGRAALAALLLFTLSYALRMARPLLLPLVVSFLLAIVLVPAWTATRRRPR